MRVLLLLIAACNAFDAPIDLEGASQKGPLVLGSSVDVSILDNRGNPTGDVYSTSTVNDFGEFALTLPGARTVEIETTGFYFNEMTGALSGAPIAMRSVANATPGRKSFVNVLTHMSSARVKDLTRNGSAGAIAQAETELRASLGIPQPEGIGPAGSMDIIGGNTPDNQYLFASSCVLMQVAATEAEAPEQIDATLQELLNNIATDLSDDGALGEANTAKIAAGLTSVNPVACEENMRARLDELGSNAVLPDIDSILYPEGSGFVEVRANGSATSFALRADGTVFAWGVDAESNSEGALSYNAMPSAITTPPARRILAAGLESAGFLGNDDSVSDLYMAWSEPHELSLGGVVGMAIAGADHVAYTDDGRFFSWIVTADRETDPVEIMGLGFIVDVAANYNCSYDGLGECFVLLTATNEIKQWMPGWDPPEREVQAVPAGIIDVEVDRYFGYALSANGAVYRWDLGWPVEMTLMGLSDIVQISTNGKRLALDSQGNVYEWDSDGAPFQIQGLPEIVQISAGYAHALALDVDGTIWAWGENGHGQLGTGATDSSDVPVNPIL